MSALPPKADIGTRSWNVRFVPKADIAANCTALEGSTSRGRSLFHFGLTARVARLSCDAAACWKRVSPRRLPASASHARQQSLAPPATEAPSLADPQLATSGVRSARQQTPMHRDGRQLFACKLVERSPWCAALLYCAKAINQSFDR